MKLQPIETLFLTLIVAFFTHLKRMNMRKILLLLLVLMVVNCKLQAIGYKLQVTSYKTQNTRHKIPGARYKGIVTGAERMEVYVPLLKGKRVGIFANPTSIVGNTNLVDTLQKRGITI